MKMINAEKEPTCIHSCHENNQYHREIKMYTLVTLGHELGRQMFLLFSSQTKYM